MKESNSTAAPNTANVCHCSFENEKGRTYSINVVVVHVSVCVCQLLPTLTNKYATSAFIPSIPEHRTFKSAYSSLRWEWCEQDMTFWLDRLRFRIFSVGCILYASHSIYKLPRIIVAEHRQMFIYLFASAERTGNGRERESATQPHKYRMRVCVFFSLGSLWF